MHRVNGQQGERTTLSCDTIAIGRMSLSLMKKGLIFNSILSILIYWEKTSIRPRKAFVDHTKKGGMQDVIFWD